MARLDDLTPNTSVRGLRPDAVVTVVATKWFGTNALELTYKAASGRLDSDILYRGTTSVTVTYNEVVTALNKPDDFYLAVVEVNGDTAGEPRCVHTREGWRRSSTCNRDLAGWLSRIRCAKSVSLFSNTS